MFLTAVGVFPFELDSCDEDFPLAEFGAPSFFTGVEDNDPLGQTVLAFATARL